MKKCSMKRIYPFLEVISRLDLKDRQILVQFLDEEGCEAITECIHNALWSKSIDPQKRRAIKLSLKQDEDKYRCILKEGCSKKRKKKLAEIGGGGLGVILDAVLPQLKEYISAE